MLGMCTASHSKTPLQEIDCSEDLSIAKVNVLLP